MSKHKCKDCIWGSNINKNLIFCMFPRCVRKDAKDKTSKIKAGEKANVSSKA